jgi:hypothetical protein
MGEIHIDLDKHNNNDKKKKLIVIINGERQPD